MESMKSSVIHCVLICFTLLLTNIYGISQSQSSGKPIPIPPRLVAHAGGNFDGLVLTNSLQALNQSYREGFRYIELDLLMTRDSVAVLSHDWEYVRGLRKLPPRKKLPTFREMKSSSTGLKLLDLKRLSRWIQKHDDVRIITDVKDHNLRMLQLIKNKFPSLQKFIIPQIYTLKEYEQVSGLGYTSIILTLYKLKIPDEEILAFCKTHDLFGLTVSKERGSGTFLQQCTALPIPVFIHTVNDPDEYRRLRALGVFGVYTDFLRPDMMPGLLQHKVN